MSTLKRYYEKSNTPFYWPALIQLIFSALAALLLLGAAAIITLTTLFQYLTSDPGGADPTQSFMVAASLAFAGVLVVPSAWYAWKRLVKPHWMPPAQAERKDFTLLLTLAVLVLVVIALWLGNLASQNVHIAWFLLPPLNIIANGLPALWLVYIGTRGLIDVSPDRKWGVFASGLVLGPLIILTLELLVLVGTGILALLWVALDPSMSNQLNDLIFRLQSVGPNQDAILRILLPILVHPGVLFVGFAVISVIIPLIEETFKPIGVWLQAGQKLTPAQGFAFGILSGAGFGLFENLGNTSGSGEAWALVASTRISTLLLHCLTAGLVGWAITSAWSQKRYLRLGITFACAVIIHGLWNSLAVISSINSLEGLADITISPNLQEVSQLAAIGVVVLGAIILFLFIGFSTSLRRNLASAGSANYPGIQPPPAEARTTTPEEGEIKGVAGGVSHPFPPGLNDAQAPASEDIQQKPPEINPPPTKEPNS